MTVYKPIRNQYTAATLATVDCRATVFFSRQVMALLNIQRPFAGCRAVTVAAEAKHS